MSVSDKFVLHKVIYVRCISSFVFLCFPNIFVFGLSTFLVMSNQGNLFCHLHMWRWSGKSRGKVRTRISQYTFSAIVNWRAGFAAWPKKCLYVQHSEQLWRRNSLILTKLFPRGQREGNIKMIIHLTLEQRVRMRGVASTYSEAFMACLMHPGSSLPSPWPKKKVWPRSVSSPKAIYSWSNSRHVT